MPRTPTEIDKGVAKSTKQTTVADKARAAPEDEGDVIAKWRRTRAVASFVADDNFALRYGRLRKTIGGRFSGIRHGARVSGEITD